MQAVPETKTVSDLLELRKNKMLRRQSRISAGRGMDIGAEKTPH